MLTTSQILSRPTVEKSALRRSDMKKRFSEEQIIGFLREADAGWR